MAFKRRSILDGTRSVRSAVMLCGSTATRRALNPVMSMMITRRRQSECEPATGRHEKLSGHNSQNMSRRRLRGMNVPLQAPPTRSASLTTSQLETVHRVLGIAGLPPTSGYAATFLAKALATDQILATTLTRVNFDDPDSVGNAVEALLQWRQPMFLATS